MDEIVKKFLDEAKAKEKEAKELAAKKKKEERDAYLVSLGLISKTERKWSEDYAHPYLNWDAKKEMYYYDCPIAVEVNDEEFAEIQKYAKYHKDESSDTINEKRPYDNGAEQTLDTINKIMLTLAVIGSIILFLVAVAAEMYILIPWALGLFFGYIILWAFVKVYINISNNLHAINNKLEKK